PRLEDVAAMVSGQLRAPGKDLATGDLAGKDPREVGAAILWTAVCFDQIVNQGSSARAAAQQIRELVPHLPPAITEAMVHAPVAAGGRRESRSVSLNDLQIGMVLEEDV